MSTEVPGRPQGQPAEQPAAAPAPATEPSPAPATGGLSQEDKTMGMLCHILAFCGLVFWAFGNILGPLILWLVKKDQSAFVNDQGKESLNFQITISIVGVGLAIASMIIQVIPILGQLVGLLLGLAGMAVGIYAVVLVIMGAIKANEGVEYRYPYNFRFIK